MPIWKNNSDKFEQCRIILDQFEHVWSIFNNFRQIWTNSNQFKQVPESFFLSAMDANMEKTRFQKLHDRKLMNNSILISIQFIFHLSFHLIWFFLCHKDSFKSFKIFPLYPQFYIELGLYPFWYLQIPILKHGHNSIYISSNKKAL